MSNRMFRPAQRRTCCAGPIDLNPVILKGVIGLDMSSTSVGQDATKWCGYVWVCLGVGVGIANLLSDNWGIRL